MADFTITPGVDETREFLEIANDFANPLDLVREAISNAFDADAINVSLFFDTVSEGGDDSLRIRITDDGNGMSKDELQAFFDLGNSLNRQKEDTIGEKGHGTKVYFNSRRVEVVTVKDSIRLTAVMEDPLKKLYQEEIPNVSVTSEDTPEAQSGTEITILRYYKNRKLYFTHQRLKDHILWFTKFGSIERCFGIENNKEAQLHLKGLDEEEPEAISFGHVFPPESMSVEDLFEEHLQKAPGYYCRQFSVEGNLKENPQKKYQALFSIEGRYVKYSYNPMLRRPGYQAPEGAYTVRERYGLWLCKDFIPIQKKDIWLTEHGRGFEFTKFHAFVNCQALNLTANRGSVDNTPPDIMSDLRDVVREIYDEITGTEEWSQLEWLEDIAEAERTIEQEKQEYKTRTTAAKSAQVGLFEDRELVAPTRESGVYGLVVQVLTLDPDALPFSIVSYDTQKGIDLLVKAKKEVPVGEAELYYVELKYELQKRRFNHSFQNTHSIVCWQTDLNEGDIISDIRDEERMLKIAEDEGAGYTRYLLDWPTEQRKIEVFVLEEYLLERYGIEFAPRNKE